MRCNRNFPPVWGDCWLLLLRGTAASSFSVPQNSSKKRWSVVTRCFDKWSHRRIINDLQLILNNDLDRNVSRPQGKSLHAFCFHCEVLGTSITPHFCDCHLRLSTSSTIDERKSAKRVQALRKQINGALLMMLHERSAKPIHKRFT